MTASELVEAKTINTYLGSLTQIMETLLQQQQVLMQQQQQMKEQAHLNQRNLLLRCRQLEGHLGLLPFELQPYFTTFTDVQATIAASQPHPDHAIYRVYEHTYWAPLLQWIYSLGQDAQAGISNPAPKVLDVGMAFGTLLGFTKACLPQAQLYGYDFYPTHKDGVINRWGITFAAGDLELNDLPFTEQFDIIIFTEILEHLYFDPRPTLAKLKNALAPNGTLYLSTPDAVQWGKLPHYNHWRDLPPVQPNHVKPHDNHIYQYTQDELRELVQTAGFTIAQEAFSPGYDGRHLVLALKHPQ